MRNLPTSKVVDFAINLSRVQSISLYFSYSRSQCAVAPYGGGSGGEAGTRVKLLDAIKNAARKNSASVPLYCNISLTS